MIRIVVNERRLCHGDKSSNSFSKNVFVILNDNFLKLKIICSANLAKFFSELPRL